MDNIDLQNLRIKMNNYFLFYKAAILAHVSIHTAHALTLPMVTKKSQI